MMKSLRWSPIIGVILFVNFAISIVLREGYGVESLVRTNAAVAAALLSLHLILSNWTSRKIAVTKTVLGLGALGYSFIWFQKSILPENAALISPTAFMALLVLSVALLSATVNRFRLHYLGFILSFAVLAISIKVLFGPSNMTQTEFTIPLHAKLSFVMLSAGTLFSIFSSHRHNMKLWPSLGALALALLTLFFWRGLIDHSNRELEKEIARVNGNIRFQIETGINSRVRLAERMARRLELSERVADQFWYGDTAELLKDFPEIGVIAQIDDRGRVKRIAPFEQFSSRINRDLDDDPRFSALVQKAHETQSSQISAVMDLNPLGLGFLVMTPYFKDSQNRGLVLILYKASQFIEATTNEMHFQFEVKFQDQVIYSNHQSASRAIDSWWRTQKLGERAPQWQVAVAPTGTIQRAARGLFHHLVLIAGVILAFLLAAFLDSSQDSVLAAGRFGRLSRYHEAILNGTNYSIIATNPDGIIVLFNRGAEALLGYRADEVIGIKTPELFHDRNEVIRRSEEMAQEIGAPVQPGFEVFIAKAKCGVTEEREWTYITQQGKRIAVGLTVTAIFDKSQNVIAYLGVARDLSEEKARLAELQRRDRMFNEAQEIAQLGSWEWDQSTRRLHVSREFCRISKLPEEQREFRASEALKVVHPDDRELVMSYAERISYGAEAVQFQYRVLKPDGQVSTVLCRGHFVMAIEDRRAKVVGTIQDITEHVHLMNDLVAAREMAEEGARAKSQFLANMSHELRTPMNGVLGTIDVLATTQLSQEQSELVSIIQRSGQQLLSIINQILDVSRIEAKMAKVHFASMDPEELMDHQAEVLYAQAAQKGLKIYTKSHCSNSLRVVSDVDLLGQILTNLVGNAVKFTESGSVKIEMQIEHDVHHDWLSYRVIDTGIGIPEDQQTRIFQAFSQVDSGSARRFSGTGLGLSIARGLAESMGGSLGLESSTPEGSVFLLRVPVQIEAEAESGSKWEPIAGAVFVDVSDSYIYESAQKYLRDRHVALAGTIQDAQTVIVDYQDENTLAKVEDLRQKKKKAILIARPGLAIPAALQGQIELIHNPFTRRKLFRCLQVQTPQESGSSVVAFPNLDGVKVLVVEDNEINFRVLRSMLDKLKVTYDHAVDGLQALDFIEEHSYDLILMDCQMPLMDGFETTTRIRALSGKKSQVPIVALTASALAGDQEKCFAVGMNGFLSKPLKMNLLVEALQQFVSRNKVSHTVSPSPTPSEESALETLRELEANGSPGLIQKLLEIFRDNTRSAIDEMYRQIATQQFEDIGRGAHTIKSSAAYLGATEMVEICKKIENLVKLAAPSVAIELAVRDLDSAFIVSLNKLDKLSRTAA